MNTLQTLIEAVQALLIKLQNSSIATGMSYCDMAIEIAQVRAEQDERSVSAFTATADGFLSYLDDVGQSDTPEWEAASLALDAQLGRNQPEWGPGHPDWDEDDGYEGVGEGDASDR